MQIKVHVKHEAGTHVRTRQRGVLLLPSLEKAGGGAGARLSRRRQRLCSPFPCRFTLKAVDILWSGAEVSLGEESSIVLESRIIRYCRSGEGYKRTKRTHTEATSGNKPVWKCPVMLPWLVWLSGLGVVLQSKRSPVQFPVRAPAWVAGSVA